MKKKFLILLLLIFISCGCNVNYEANFLDNGRIEEKIKIKFENEKILQNYKNENISNNEIIESYIKEKLNEFEEYLDYPKYNYQVKIGEKNTELNLAYTYNNILEFKEKNIYSNGFKSLKIEQEGKNYYFNSGSYTGGGEDFIINNLNISIITNNFVKDDNATKASVVKGEYTWEFPSKDSDNIKINITNKENWIKKMFGTAPVVFYILVILIPLIIFSTIVYIVYINIKSKNSI